MVVLLVILTVAVVISVQLLAERYDRGKAYDLSPASVGTALSANLFIHGGHTWAQLDTSGEAKVGIDHFLLRVLGGVDTVSLPEPGRSVRQGEKIFSVSRGGKEIGLVAPIEGVVATVNRHAELPDGRNRDAVYRQGWLFTIRPRNLAGSLRNVKTLDCAASWFDSESKRFASFLVAGAPRFAEVGVTLQDGGNYPAGVIEKMDDAQLRAFEQEFLS
jgi:glycine cleavage system H lipoate-binding protein